MSSLSWECDSVSGKLSTAMCSSGYHRTSSAKPEEPSTRIWPGCANAATRAAKFGRLP